jgi:hypothetical protein
VAYYGFTFNFDNTIPVLRLLKGTSTTQRDEIYQAVFVDYGKKYYKYGK